MMFRSLVAALALCMAPSAFATQSTPLSYELARLAEIVNTRIPYQYRSQLNIAIGRLEMTAAQECSGRPRQPQQPICNIESSGSGFVVVRKDSVMSQYSRNSIIAAKQDYNELVNAGVCPNEDIRMSCSVERTSSGGGFVVMRDGKVASQYSRNSAVAAAQDMKEMVAAELCY